MIVMLLLAALAVPQDPPAKQDHPKVTYEDSGDFRLLVMDLGRRFDGRIRFGKGVPQRKVSVSVRDAGYFEALDALCRAHKEATYFPSEAHDEISDRLRIVSGPWVDYPSSYTGHFKVALTSMMRTVRSSPEGDTSRSEAALAFFTPPWIETSWASGARLVWSFEEARDSGGRDLLEPEMRAPEPWLADRMAFVMESRRGHDFASTRSIFLRDFELSKGLKLLAGKIILSVPEYRVVRLAAESGATVDIPQGTLAVTAVDKEEEESIWTIAVTFKPKEATSKVSLRDGQFLASQVRYDGGSREWTHITLNESSFEVETSALKGAPKWMELRAILARREVEVPFRFADVVFRGD